MTNAEAIKTLKANYPDACYEQLREAVDAAIEALKVQIKSEWTAKELDYLTEVESTTKTTQDWVMVVRCKDCKFYWKNMKDNTDEPVPVCLASPKIDAFCSEGERKDDE